MTLELISLLPRALAEQAQWGSSQETLKPTAGQSLAALVGSGRGAIRLKAKSFFAGFFAPLPHKKLSTDSSHTTADSNSKDPRITQSTSQLSLADSEDSVSSLTASEATTSDGDASAMSTETNDQLHPALAAAEAKSLFRTENICVTCGKSGTNLPICAKGCGETFCCRACIQTAEHTCTST